jgi:hypothetical protein
LISIYEHSLLPFPQVDLVIIARVRERDQRSSKENYIELRLAPHLYFYFSPGVALLRTRSAFPCWPGISEFTVMAQSFLQSLYSSPEINPLNLKAKSIPILNPINRYGRVFFFSWFGFMVAFLSW